MNISLSSDRTEGVVFTTPSAVDLVPNDRLRHCDDEGVMWWDVWVLVLCSVTSLSLQVVVVAERRGKNKGGEKSL